MTMSVRLRMIVSVLAVSMVAATYGQAQTNDQFFRSWQWSTDQAPARVAGLGGAFVAVADDSSAILFNPAGLVGVQKTEIMGAMVARRRGTTASQLGDTLHAFADIGFAGGSAAISSKWSIGGYCARAHDRRTELDAVSLPDGTGTAGFLRTQVTEAGGALAWQVTRRLSVGARLTATHLKLEAHEVRAGAVASEVGAAGGETRVTGSFGGLLGLTPKLRLGISGQPGTAYRIHRTANRAGRAVDVGSESELQQPGLVSLGAAFQGTPRILVAVQVDYVRYSQVLGEFVVRSGTSEPREYQVSDAIEPHAALEVSIPRRLFSIQLRAGLHVMAPGFLAYGGAAPVEAMTFRGGGRLMVAGFGASIVTRGGFRTDLSGRTGSEQQALGLAAGIRF